jgi:uncharacterized membrane protein
MVFIMHVLMAVLQWFVLMEMLVTLRQVQPDPQSHDQARQQQTRRDGLTKQRHSQGRPKKRRDRKIGSGSGSAQGPQGKDE